MLRSSSVGFIRGARAGFGVTSRIYIQYEHEAEFVGEVERITGRTVRGFVSGIDTKQGLSTEFFYLEPSP